MKSKKEIITDIDLIVGKNTEVTDLTHMDLVDEISDYIENLKLHIVGVRLPIGSKVTIIDDENNFKEDAGKEKTITEYINYLGKTVGYYLDKDDTKIFLIEDFER